MAEELRTEGFLVKGTGDAHGAIDLIALKKGHQPLVIQVKGNRDGGPYANFRPLERILMAAEAIQAGAAAYLAWAPPDRKPTRWYHVDQWPKPRLDNPANCDQTTPCNPPQPSARVEAPTPTPKGR